MATVNKFLIGSIGTLASTELNSLASGSAALGAAYNNTVAGGGGDGYTLGDIECYVDFGGNTASTGSTIDCWFIRAQDGSTYEDGAAGVIPIRPPDAVFALRGVSGTQRIVVEARIPWGFFKALVYNDSTGFGLASTGNTLKVRPVTVEGV